MKSGSLAGREDEHNGAGFVEISKIAAQQDTIFFGIEQFDRIYCIINKSSTCLSLAVL